MKIKALSFRQPWAELVLAGKKTLDLRTWNTNYRGKLAIYASQTIEPERCSEFGIDAKTLTTGAVIGVVDLLGVVELDENTYMERSAEHLGGRNYHSPMFGWELANPRMLTLPQPAKGRTLLFEVDIPEDAFVSQMQPAYKQPEIEVNSEPTVEISLGDAPPFELRLIPEADPKTNQPSYRLGVFQRKLAPSAVQSTLYAQSPELMDRVVELGGSALRSVADQVLEALRSNGYRATDLNPKRLEPFLLQEEWGVRLGLLFLAVKPITKASRVEVISAGIRQMTSEELYYWYSKCTSRATAERAQKALRLLLADE